MLCLGLVLLTVDIFGGLSHKRNGFGDTPSYLPLWEARVDKVSAVVPDNALMYVLNQDPREGAVRRQPRTDQDALPALSIANVLGARCLYTSNA